MSECTGKKKFTTKTAALICGVSSLRHDPPDTNQYRAYLCPRCRYWHVTKEAQ